MSFSSAKMEIAGRLRGKAFEWQRWTAPHTEWSHDHCFFCSARISDRDGDYAHAFVLREEGNSPFWVCRACFKAVRNAPCQLICECNPEWSRLGQLKM